MRAVNVGGISVAGVGMLASSTAPLPLGLLGYHLYLVWAGMTTNESAKWADWRDDVADGSVYTAKRSAVLQRARERKRASGRVGEMESLLEEGDEEGEEQGRWAVKGDSIITRTVDGRPPPGQEELWERVTSLEELVNIYDLGFARNLLDILRGR